MIFKNYKKSLALSLSWLELLQPETCDRIEHDLKKQRFRWNNPNAPDPKSPVKLGRDTRDMDVSQFKELNLAGWTKHDLVDEYSCGKEKYQEIRESIRDELANKKREKKEQ